MKTSIVLAAISAILSAAELLPPPANFPVCGTTCLNGVLTQAVQLGCGGQGSTADAVDGACLCKNINFSYGIIDCANAACAQGEAQTVIQYGINWCAEKGVIVDGLSASADPVIASSPTFTVMATATTGEGGSASGGAPVTTSEIISTVTNSDGSAVPTTIGTTIISNGTSKTSATDGVLVPVSTSAIVSTLTNSDGSVETTTLATSTIFSTSFTASGSGTESGSATGSGSASETTIATESTNTAAGSTEATGATASSTDDAATPSSTDSGSGSRQTAAPAKGFVRGERSAPAFSFLEDT
ncbi:hypothetical protein F5Y14DRAFT_447470 [Nemania sp. NC0429]|nr:hypothetical protein F5Y14DRAFT_447470 [Nemania sp. NC0429]